MLINKMRQYAKNKFNYVMTNERTLTSLIDLFNRHKYEGIFISGDDCQILSQKLSELVKNYKISTDLK